MSRKRHAKDKAEKTSAEDEKHAEETPSEKVEPLEDKQVRFIAASFWSKPWLKVELDNDDPISAKSIKISGRRVDEQMSSVLQKILPSLKQLQRLQFWKAELTDRMVISLMNTVSLCSNLRVVILEGNPLPEQSYHCLLSDSSLTHLSLRNNRIGDDCARLIGSALSTTTSSNKNLMSLSLSFNCIGDAGAAHIAQGLRFNHALLFLSLANNWIGESGATCLAEILGNFALTHEEVVERRKLLLKRIESGSEQSLRADSAQTIVDELPKVPSNTSLSGGKGEKKPPKKKGTSSKEKSAASKEKLKPHKKASSVKAQQSKGRKMGDKEKLEAQSCTSLNEVELVEPENPLLDQTPQRKCGQLFLPGNSTLVSLNLAGNRITEKILPLFQTSLEMQKKGGGLLRLCLQRNCFSEQCESYVKIQNLLAKRHEREKSTDKKQTERESAN